MHTHYAALAACIWSTTAGATAASPRGKPESSIRSSGVEPCAKISQLYAQGASQVPADLAYDCLRSVPLDVEGDIELIDEMGPYFEWQSNQAYLANPPPHWDNPRLDLVQELAKIRHKLTQNAYESEYEFANELYDLPLRSQDNHFSYTPDIMGLFSFQRDVVLTSVSADGHSLPQVYIYSDILPRNGTTAPANGSHVTHINGIDVETYLNSLGPFRDNGQWHDADARYNSLYQAAILNHNLDPSFSLEYHYVGPSTELTFSNGTALNYRNMANILVDFSNVTDGKSLFEKFCSGTPAQGPNTTPPNVPGLPQGRLGYPDPLTTGEGIAAYHLKASAPDILVLSISTFLVKDTASFQTAVEEAIAYSENNSLKKLVIDLRTNDGGYVELAYALVKQLFPSIAPYDTQRYRATYALETIGQVATRFFRDNTTEEVLSGGSDVYNTLSWYSYKQWMDTDGNAFASAQDMYRKTTLNGDQFIAIQREMVSNPLAMSIVNMTGYIYHNSSHDSGVSGGPFATEDIVMLQDGFCSSTCSDFAEMMKTQAHVKTIVMGGRPQYGPMQGIGGVKGGPILPFSELHETAKAAYAFSDKKTRLKLMQSSFGTLIRGGRPLKRVVVNGDGSIMASLNAADNIRKGDTTGTPLEFVYEAADCRLFYTADMMLDVKKTWKRVAEAQWGAKVNGSSPLCVRGSTGHPSAVSREGVPWGVQEQREGAPTNKTPSTTPTAPPLGTGGVTTGSAIALSTSSIGLLAALIVTLMI